MKYGTQMLLLLSVSARCLFCHMQHSNTWNCGWNVFFSILCIMTSLCPKYSSWPVITVWLVTSSQ